MVTKGKRFDSMKDVLTEELLKKFGLIHYNNAVSKYLKNNNEWSFFNAKLL